MNTNCNRDNDELTWTNYAAVNAFKGKAAGMI